MTIRTEFVRYLAQNYPQTRFNRDRDVNIVSMFYGFGDASWPTLESIGDSYDLTRERIRQVVNHSFLDEASISELPLLQACGIELESVKFIDTATLKTRLLERGLVDESFNPRGLLNLLQDLGLCKRHDLFRANLEPQQRGDSEEEQTFLATASYAARLSRALHVARTLPGQLGLVRFTDLRAELASTTSIDFLAIESLLRAHNECRTLTVDGVHWYMFSDRVNTLLNSCGKLFSTSIEVPTDELAATLARSLKRRSGKYPYPDADVIEAWIRQSPKWFSTDGTHTSFSGTLIEITPIERDLVNFLRKAKRASYTSIREHLTLEGHDNAIISKIVGSSPLVHVEGRRGNYTYRLHARRSDEPHPTDLRAAEFQARLSDLLRRGTDAPTEDTRRREQAILREWLFGDSPEHCCAVCGYSFSVRALVVAHKKPRAQCCENERTDVNVVMPLCVFGCDYLYEQRMIVIRDGTVRYVGPAQQRPRDHERGRELDGRPVPEVYLRGNLAYFDLPQEKATSES